MDDDSTITLDSLEVLRIDNNGNGIEWEIASGKLPIPLYGHTMTEFEDGFILMGGSRRLGEHGCKMAWKGIWKDNEITFESLPPMNEERAHHFSLHTLTSHLTSKEKLMYLVVNLVQLSTLTDQLNRHGHNRHYT